MEANMKKMNRLRVLAVSTLFVALAACDTEDASKAVVDNGYRQTVVYRAWWVATYFPEPVAGATTSSEQRSVPASDFAYAVLAPNWDPASATPPATFVVVKSKTPLSVARGDTLHITVDDQTFTGSCAADQPLSQEEADFITQRIFPGEFANVTYDAKTCASTPAASAANDAGADGD
jgi:hypothetical protein